MVQIFISYAREDYDVVRQLYNRLRAAGYNPWMDKVDLPKGADFAKAIPKVLRESDLFIVCLSPRSVEKRSFIQREINLALDAWEQKLEDDLYIFPLRLEACKAPERIGNFNWTDLFGDDHEDEWKALLQALNAQAQRLSIDVIPAAPPLKSSPSSNRRVVVTGNMQHRAIFSGDHKTLILARTRTPPSSPKSASLPANFTESIKGVPLEMIFVPAGKFMMGSTEMHNEMPPHKVSIPSFHIGKYQVTQAQWKAVMGDKLKPYFKGDNLPMENISWNNTKKFCENLSKLTGKDYRLPSEAEWEYACRAGTTSDYAGKLDQMAWYMKDSKGKTRPVGQKSPNAFGVYDMHGNVWEWCEDVWHNNYDRAPKDGSAWSQRRDVYDEWRVLRGGSWFYSGAFCRSAFRSDNYSSHRDNMIGFRVVVSARTL